MRREKIKHIVELTHEAVNTPYELGKNDCNILVLKAVDIMCSTEYAQEAIGKYDSVSGGLKLLKDYGFDSLEDLVSKHGTLTEYPIIGDILIDGLNASVCLHDSYVEMNHETNSFTIGRLVREKGKYYRIG